MIDEMLYKQRAYAAEEALKESMAWNAILTTEDSRKMAVIEAVNTWYEETQLGFALPADVVSAERSLCESIEKYRCDSVSDRRVSTENGRAEKVDSPVIADDRQWIPVGDRLPEPDNQEIEIAFWDGCYMCRVFGAYDAEMEEDPNYDGIGWCVAQEPLNANGLTVTHWRYPVALPEPPADERQK